MYVAVTGGTGLLGSAVIRHFVAEGCRVVNVDQQPPADIDTSAQFRQTDIRDFTQVREALTGAEVIVHCAGIPRPGSLPPDLVFSTNVQGTFNVFEAARVNGSRRVVYASSIAVLGFPFFERHLTPTYLPVDEHSPRLAQDPYGLSKLIGEDIAQGFVQRCDMTAVSLRFPWIHTPGTFRERIVPLHETDPASDGPTNLWAYIDTRDAARICWLAATQTIEGHQVIFAAASDTFMPEDTRALIERHYPETELRGPLTGRSALIATGRAQSLLGFVPEYRWETYL